MRSSWLYLATRSERAGAPDLIWPQLVATARSAIVTSSVSPERCDITERYDGASRARHRFERLGERADLVDLDQHRVRDARRDAAIETFDVGDEEVVADELDLARRPPRMSDAQPSQSSSAMPSSIETIG